MSISVAFLFVYLATCLFIGLLFYAIFRRELELPTYQIKNGPTSISVKKTFNGVPGMDKGNATTQNSTTTQNGALPQPTMPKAPKPLIVKTSYSQ
jgi:hypothetical protein